MGRGGCGAATGALGGDAVEEAGVGASSTEGSRCPWRSEFREAEQRREKRGGGGARERRRGTLEEGLGMRGERECRL